MAAIELRDKVLEAAILLLKLVVGSTIKELWNFSLLSEL